MILVTMMLSIAHISIARAGDDQVLPPDSVYHLQLGVEDQNGDLIQLDRYKGQPVLVTMFYASCPHVCPMLISTIKILESELTEEERDQLRVMTISIDPERDTAEKLLQTMTDHSIDAHRWSMVRPDHGDLRMIAGVFGIKYKKLPGGEFNHTTRIILLDRDGIQLANTEQIGRVDANFLEAVKTSLR